MQAHFGLRSKDYVFTFSELNEVETTTVEALQAFKRDHGIQDCARILNGGTRSLKERICIYSLSPCASYLVILLIVFPFACAKDMAGNNMLALAEKRAKREAAKKAAADAEVAVGTVAGTSTPQSPNPGAISVSQVRLRKKARTEELKGSHDTGKGDDSSTSHSGLQTSFGVPSSPRISWATPDPEEDAAMKLLGQQGQHVFRGSSAAEMKDFLGQIKKDFEAVSKKLKEDEVKMQDALKKVKGLSDDNVKLTDKNKELEEEVEKLKSALAAKRSEATQAIIEKQKMAEGLEDAKEEWKLQAAKYEKEIRRVEDLWDESAEIFFHNAIDQIKFLNPGVDLCTRGMSTLCVVRDGKWYQGTGEFFVEEAPSDMEITPPPMQPITLEADAVRDEMKSPTESEMVDAKILGLDDSKPPEGETEMPSTVKE
ncbi:AH/BAR domain superfamily [Sesbania bispinosa]|nr:AH/BAR domain superfamily [Sesbania bispinosa]